MTRAASAAPPAPLTRGTPTVAYVGSYAPRECGIATFARDVITALDKLTRVDRAVVIAVNEPDGHHAYPSRVERHIERDVVSSYDLAADAVNASDCELVSIQHEYGLFGGTWGSFLLRFMARVRQPAVVTLHTVLPNPDPPCVRLPRRSSPIRP